MNRIARGASLGILVFLANSPLHAAAAELSFQAPPSLARPVSTDTVALPVLLTLDTNECVNAAQLDIALSTKTIRTVEFAPTEAFDLVAESLYDAEHGILHFAAGTPHAICGGRTRSITLGTLQIQKKSRGKIHLNFMETTEVSLDDGYGTAADLTTRSIVL